MFPTFVQKSFSIRFTRRVYLFCRRRSKNIFCVLYYFRTGNFKTFFGNLFKFRIIFLLCRDIRQLSTLCYILQQNRHPALLPRKRFFKLFSDFIPNVVISLRPRRLYFNSIISIPQGEKNGLGAATDCAKPFFLQDFL